MNYFRVVTLIILVLVLSGNAVADLTVKAISPQDVNGVISQPDSFHVDIWIKVGEGDPSISGGTIGFKFFSVDGSLGRITHLAVPDVYNPSLVQPVSTHSVEYLNGFLDYYSLVVFPFENGWGDGSLPDFLAFDVAGTSGLNSTLPDQPYFRFNFRASGPGIFCVAPINNEDTEFDWFFGGEYTDTTCWSIGDYSTVYCGDADGSGVIDILDVVYIINYKYKDGSAPDPLESADVDGTPGITILDVVYLINFKYKEGPEPVCP